MTPIGELRPGHRYLHRARHGAHSVVLMLALLVVWPLWRQWSRAVAWARWTTRSRVGRRMPRPTRRRLGIAAGECGAELTAGAQPMRRAALFAALAGLVLGINARAVQVPVALRRALHDEQRATPVAYMAGSVFLLIPIMRAGSPPPVGGGGGGGSTLVEAPPGNLPEHTTFNTSDGTFTLGQYYYSDSLTPAPANRLAAAHATPADSTALQAALDASASAAGDYIIQLTPGVTYGATTFTAPAVTTRPGTLIIRSGTLAGIPLGLDPTNAANRATSAHAASMATIRGTGTGPSAFEIAKNCDRVWIEGVRFTLNDATPNYTRIVGTDPSTYASASDAPDRVAVVHCVIDAPPATVQVRRGMMHEWTRAFLALNSIYGCRFYGSQTQGIGATGYCTRSDVVGNRIEGLGQNILLGGGDTNAGGTTAHPTHIRYLWNHIYKDVAWKTAFTDAFGPSDVSCLIELKKGTRVLIYGNVLDGSWASIHEGTAFKIKQTHQNGTTADQQLQDVTVRANVIRNTATLFSFVGAEQAVVTTGALRIELAYNLAYEINTVHASIIASQLGTVGVDAAYYTTAPNGLAFHHNTCILGTSGGHRFIEPTPEAPYTSSWNGVRITDNVIRRAGGQQLVRRGGTAEGTPSIDPLWPSYQFTRNLFFGDATVPPNTPAGNLFHATLTFVNEAARNYRLVSGQPGKAAGLNGEDYGYDAPLVETATATVV